MGGYGGYGGGMGGYGGYGGGYGGYGGGVSSQRVRYKPVQDRVLYLCFILLIFLLTPICFHLLLQYGGYGRGGYGGGGSGGYGLGYSNMNNFPETRERGARRRYSRDYYPNYGYGGYGGGYGGYYGRGGYY